MAGIPYYIIAPSCDCRESYTKSLMPIEVNLYRCLSLLRKVRPETQSPTARPEERKSLHPHAGTVGRVPIEAGPGIAHTDDGRVAGEARRKGLEAHQVYQRGSIARQSGSRTGTKGGRSGTKSKTKQRKNNCVG